MSACTTSLNSTFKVARLVLMAAAVLRASGDALGGGLFWMKSPWKTGRSWRMGRGPLSS